MRNVSPLAAITVTSEATGILRICEGANEGQGGWRSFLKGRGLAGVRLIISDACLGLAESAAEFFRDATGQTKCATDSRHFPAHR